MFKIISNSTPLPVIASFSTNGKMIPIYVQFFPGEKPIRVSAKCIANAVTYAEYICEYMLEDDENVHSVNLIYQKDKQIWGARATQRLTSEAVRLSAEIKNDASPALPESAPDFIHKIPQSPQKMSTRKIRVLIFLKPEYIFLTVFTCHIQRIRLCNLHIGIFNHVVVILNLICLKDSIF